MRPVLLACLTSAGVLVAVPRLAPAQRDTRENTNAWFSWFSEVELGHGWAVEHDVSHRRSGPVKELASNLWRVSLRRDLTNGVRVAAGYAGTDLHPYGKLPATFRTPEHRSFEQLSLAHAVARVQLTQRYRFEQRWTGRVASVGGDTGVQNWVRTNRARYFVRATIPLKGDTLDIGEWYVNVSNEVMLNWGANVQQNVLDQNRSQVTIGRRLGKGTRVEVGYLEQLFAKPNGRQLERNHTLLTTLTTAVHLGS
jgi:hypothetical protein